jgi:hypothetical protein
MKKFNCIQLHAVLISACLSVCVSTFVRAQLPSYIPSNGLVAWYPFNGNANDESGNGFNGQAQNGVQLGSDRANQINSCYVFDGVDDHLAISGQFNSGQTLPEFTVSCWFQADNQKEQILWGKSGFWKEVVLSVNANNQVSFFYAYPSPQAYYGITASNPINPNGWNHAVVSQLNGFLYLYLNGVLIQSTSSNSHTNWAQDNSGCSTGDNFIGMGRYCQVYNYLPFKGKLDDIGFWNRALSAAEVSTLYSSISACAPTFSTLSASIIQGETYNFNGQSLTASGTYESMLTNAAGCDSVVTLTLSVEALPLSCEVISTNQFICSGDSASLEVVFDASQISTSGAIYNPGSPNPWSYPAPENGGYIPLGTFGTPSVFSISCYINPSDVQAGIAIIMDCNHGGSYNWVIQNFPNISSGSNWSFGNLPITLTPNEWQHLLITYDNGNRKCFVNGILQSSTFQLISWSGYPSLFLGNWPEGARRFHGGIDELYITYDIQQSSNFVPTDYITTTSPSTFGLWHFEESAGLTTQSAAGSNYNLNNWIWTTRNSQNTSVYWSTGETTPSIAVSPTETTTYSVTVTQGDQTCTSDVTITVNQPSSAAIEATITDGETYEFNGQSLTNAGTYEAVLTNAAGCDSIVMLTLSVEAVPLECDVVAGATTICAGEEVSLSLMGLENVQVSQSNCWQAVSAPQNHYLRIIRADNGSYFVSTYQGSQAQLYTTNDPNSWMSSSNPLPTGLHLMSGKTQSGKLFISSSHNGVFSSTNNGMTWSYAFGNGFGCAALDFEESTPGTLFISLGGFLRGIYKSIDDGLNWSSTVTSLDFTDIEWVSGTNVLYAQNTNGQLWKSSNMGSTWSALTSAPFYGLAGKVESIGTSVWVFAVDGKVYRSNDQASTWSLIATLPFTGNASVYNNDFVIDQQGSWWLGMNSQGIWRSTNSGTSWASADECLSGEFRYFYLDGGTLYTTTNTSINKFGLNPQSITWSNGETTPTISVAPTETTTYSVTVTQGDQTCTSDVTITVNQPSATAIEATITEGETYDFNGQSLTIAGTYEAVLTNAAGCDSVVTLTLSVDVVPLECGIEASADAICLGESVQLQVSSNGTVVNDSCSWTQVSGGDCYRLIAGPNGKLFIPRRTDILRSTDNGMTWTNAGWPLGIVRSGTSVFHGAVYNTITNQYIQCALDNGYWVSNDDGNSFVQTGPTGFGCAGVEMLQLNSGLVLGTMGGFQRGVYKSNNLTNTTWSNRYPGVDPYDFVSFNDQVIFSATSNNILKSTNQGDSWTALFGGTFYDVEKMGDSLVWINSAGNLFVAHLNAVGNSIPSRSNLQSGYFDVKFDSISNLLIAAHTSAGIYISSNHGYSWELCTITGATSYYDISIYEGKLYIGTNVGLYTKSLTLSALNWSTGEATQSITVAPTETTTYSVTVTQGNQTCTSDVTIIVNQPSSAAIEASIIEGETYDFNGQSLTTAGTYEAVLTNAAGCDSVVTLTLSVEVPLNCVIEASASSICNGEEVELMFSGSPVISNLPSDFILLNEYGGKKYYLYPQMISWEEAKSLGDSYGVSMYIVNDALEEQTIYSSLPNVGDDGIHYWLGLSQVVSSQDYSEPAGGWYWVDGSNLLGGYSNWEGGEPNNADGGENYAQFEWSDDGIGWNDAGYPAAQGTQFSMPIYEVGNSIGANIIWSTGESTTSIIVSPTETTIYSVTAAQGDQTCTSAVTINVSQPSSAALEASITVGETYNFNGQSLTAAGTYEAFLTNAVGCDSIVMLTLSVEVPLNCEIVSSASSICNGEEVELMFSGSPAISNLPSDFILLNEYGGKKYYLYPQMISWEEAKSLGDSYGVSMYIVNDALEEQTIYSSLPNVGDDGIHYWLGLSQVVSSQDYSEPAGGWYWVDGSNLLGGYSNWEGGEPNNADGGENYAQFEWSDDGIGWNDAGYPAAQGTQFSMPIYEVGNSMGANIIWSNGETTPTITVAPTETTTYSVTVTQGNQTCTSEVTIEVLANETYYADADGDGFGNFEMPLTTCGDIPAGYTLDNTDCNDGDALNYPFASCDDGDPCTIEDVIQSDCSCAGFFADSDDDGTCDAQDLCPGSQEPGTPCDDFDPCTINDVIIADCFCLGTFADVDGDGTCDANDLCAGQEAGTACDDNDACTINDVIQSDCTCAGTFADGDGDGTCDANDLCAGPEAGTACDDNDACTINDVIQSDCTCAGTFADADGDGTCDANDLCAGPEAGSACDDSDACTINDVIQSDCTCAGTFADADGDGTCDANDLCEGPEAGTACDDNDPCTVNDVIQSDCTCAGTFADGDGDGTCDANDLCAGPEAGTACDDNDPCTVNDLIQSDCTCAGTFADGDGDGTCDANDLCEGPEQGGSCDDDDPCTTNDTVQSDCSCRGTIVEPAFSSVSAHACGPYTWNNNTYSQSGTYQVTLQNAAGCDSIAQLVLTIGAPTTSSESATACGSYTWNGTTYSQSGAYTFVSTNASGCPNTATLNLTINTLSVAPTGATASQNTVTAGSQVTLTVQGGTLGTGAQWKWYRSACGGTLLGTGSSITITANTTDSYYVRAEGTCNTTACASVTVNVQSAACGPQTISATATSVCYGSSTTLTVVGNTGTGGVWKWYKNGCGSGTCAGTGASLTVSPTSTTTYFVRSEGGSCGITACLSITINVTPLPSKPSSITGPTTGLCGLQNVTYTTSNCTGATSYQWTVPAGVAIVSGQGTASITVNYSSTIGNNTSCGSASICVRSGNSCGWSSYKCKELQLVPSTPSNISGSPTPCRNQVTTYNISAVSGATSYMWTVPSGSTIQSGQGTTSISVLTGGNNGSISVRAVNSCGQSSQATRSVRPKSCNSSMPVLDLWPNPTSERVYFSYEDEMPEMLEIYDMMGRTIYTGTWLPEFDVSSLAGGIYFVRATSGGESVVKRMEIAR